MGSYAQIWSKMQILEGYVGFFAYIARDYDY